MKNLIFLFFFLSTSLNATRLEELQKKSDWIQASIEVCNITGQKDALIDHLLSSLPVDLDLLQEVASNKKHSILNHLKENIQNLFLIYQKIKTHKDVKNSEKILKGLGSFFGYIATNQDNLNHFELYYMIYLFQIDLYHMNQETENDFNSILIFFEKACNAISKAPHLEEEFEAIGYIILYYNFIKNKINGNEELEKNLDKIFDAFKKQHELFFELTLLQEDLKLLKKKKKATNSVNQSLSIIEKHVNGLSNIESCDDIAFLFPKLNLLFQKIKHICPQRLTAKKNKIFNTLTSTVFCQSLVNIGIFDNFLKKLERIDVDNRGNHVHAFLANPSFEEAFNHLDNIEKFEELVLIINKIHKQIKSFVSLTTGCSHDFTEFTSCVQIVISFYQKICAFEHDFKESAESLHFIKIREDLERNPYIKTIVSLFFIDDFLSADLEAPQWKAIEWLFNKIVDLLPNLLINNDLYYICYDVAKKVHEILEKDDLPLEILKDFPENLRQLSHFTCQKGYEDISFQNHADLFVWYDVFAKNVYMAQTALNDLFGFVSKVQNPSMVGSTYEMTAYFNLFRYNNLPAFLNFMNLAERFFTLAGMNEKAHNCREVSLQMIGNTGPGKTPQILAQ